MMEDNVRKRMCECVCVYIYIYIYMYIYIYTRLGHFAVQQKTIIKKIKIKKKKKKMVTVTILLQGKDEAKISFLICFQSVSN